MISLTEENYLKAIYALNSDKVSIASTNAIAERMKTKASSVSDMLRRLKDKELINYQKYQAVTLTEQGEQIAISIIRKHRLWEYFLVKKLKFGWDEVHDLAEQLEHIRSPKLTNHLEEFLEYPEFDPHGDPIPDRNGKFPVELSHTLADSNQNEVVTVVGVKDHSTEFLGYLDQLSIQLGTQLTIRNINSFDKSMELLNNENTALHVSHEVAKNLFVKIK